jgi:membrane protease YdiL (CAAX protease family)
MHTTTTFLKQTFEHFYLGIAITAVYVIISPGVLESGYPGIASLLLVELLVLTPIIVTHLLVIARKQNHSWSLDDVILYRTPIGGKSFLLWFIFGLIAINATYIPLCPVGIYFRNEIFTWLPGWYFNPGYGTEDRSLLANLFLIGIIVDGIIAPVLEELYFRGYLLPRMSYLKGWAPLVNGAFFGLYHFWQPHNLVALIVVGTILSYVVWKTKNVYLGIALHCAINIVGAAGGYFAVVNGIDISR